MILYGILEQEPDQYRSNVQDRYHLERFTAWNGMKLSDIISLKGADNDRYDVIVCLCLAGVAAVLAIAGVVYKFVRKKPQDR